MPAIGRKDQIKRVAENLFRQNGYSATSMRNLAKEIGIEPASIYSHINSKEEILQQICFGLAAKFFDALTMAREYETNSAEEKLKKAIQNHINVILKNNDASAVFFHDWRHLSQPFLNEFLKMRKEYEQGFIEIIEAGIRKGEFKKVNSKILVLTLFSALNWTYEWYNPKGKLDAEEISTQLSDVLIFGLNNKK